MPTEEDIIQAYKDHNYIERPIKLEEAEIIHQWEASLVFKCGEETCMGTLIYEDGKWRVR